MSEDLLNSGEASATNPYGARVPFKSPLEYFLGPLHGDPANFERWDVMRGQVGWETEDNDLHVYPYTHAVSAMLSAGCEGRCKFCPTAKHFKGTVLRGDPEKILPAYAGRAVHFMDEDFLNNDMDVVLPLLRRFGIRWTFMTVYPKLRALLDKYGEAVLVDSGLVCVELGLENVVLMKKCDDNLKCDAIAVYYLNLCCLPGETKESIRANAIWMTWRSLLHPIHFNNGVWYAPGQFYFPYGEQRDDGRFVDATKARTRPTFIPHTLLNQDFTITDIEAANHYSQLVFGEKMYPEKLSGNVGEFIGTDHHKALWLIEAFRVGAAV